MPVSPSDFGDQNLFKLLEPSDHCDHNAHIFGLMFSTEVNREQIISKMQAQGVGTAFHYVPLHQAKAGIDFCKVPMKLPVSEKAGSSFLRLPLYSGLSDNEIRTVVGALASSVADKG